MRKKLNIFPEPANLLHFLQRKSIGQLDVTYIKMLKHVIKIKKKEQVETWRRLGRENSQKLRVLAGFPEDLGSVPTCHGRQLTTTCDSKLWIPGGLAPSSSLRRTCTLVAYGHTNTHTH